MNTHPARTLRVLALLCGLVACATAGTQHGPSSKKDNLITSAEFDSLSLRTAYDIVQRLRPTWFTKASQAGTSTLGVSVSPSGAGAQTAGGAGIVVYMDNTRMGGLTALQEITAASVGSIEFMDAASAQARLANLHSDVISGAIVIHSRVGR
jgi:hypothetical protein